MKNINLSCPPQHSRSSLIDQFFSGEYSCEWKCVESEEEEVTHTTDKFQQLLCHINQDVKYLHTGLVARMQVCNGAAEYRNIKV